MNDVKHDSTQAPLAGRVVLVTGGGRASARLFAKTWRGTVRTWSSPISTATARPPRAALERHGGPAVGRPLDVRDEASVLQVVHDAREALGDLDVVVNNAAIDVTAPIDDVSVDAWRQVLMTNLLGPYLMCHAAVPMMKARGTGHIVNIASTASKRAWPNASAYHATKWGLLGLSHALHAELRPAGVSVSAIVAGCARRSCSTASRTSTRTRCSRPRTSRPPCASC